MFYFSYFLDNFPTGSKLNEFIAEENTVVLGSAYKRMVNTVSYLCSALLPRQDTGLQYNGRIVPYLFFRMFCKLNSAKGLQERQL
jgi:hypothetical protein